MSSISDAEDTAVGSIVSATRDALTTFATDIEGVYATQITDLQAVVTSTQTQLEQTTSALAAATAADSADQAEVAALTEQLATANAQLATAQAATAAVQAAFDAYVKSHPDPIPSTPVLGFGASVQGGDQTAFVKTIGGVQLGVHRSYFVATDSPVATKVTRETHPYKVHAHETVLPMAAAINAVAARATADLALGTLPVISIKLPGTWGSVASGSQDAWLASLWAALGAVQGRLKFCFHHEPVDDVQAAGSGMTQADFLAMYAHALQTVPANVDLGPIIQSAPFDGTGASSGDITTWIPKGVAFAGIDCYNHWDTNKKDSVWRTPQQVMVCVDQLKSLGLPVIIAEWGVRTDPRTPGKAAQWMADFVALAILKAIVVALSYFNSAANVNDGGIHPWTLDGERLTEFAALNQQYALAA